MKSLNLALVLAFVAGLMCACAVRVEAQPPPKVVSEKDPEKDKDPEKVLRAKEKAIKDQREADLKQLLDKEAATIRTKGVEFAPFRVKVAQLHTDRAYTVWDTNSGHKADTEARFFQVGKDGDFCPLGDYVWIPGAAGQVLLFAGDKEYLQHPTGFTHLMDDQGSSNDRSLNYWKPVPPAGFRAVGLCFNNSEDKQPDPNNYYCVAKGKLFDVQSGEYWSDAGSHFVDNGDVRRPTFAEGTEAFQDEILLLPTTFIDALDRHQLQPYAIRATQGYIDAPEVLPQKPDKYLGEVDSNTQTARGLKKIAIVPCTTVPDGIDDQGGTSPFYFVACEPYWSCTGSERPPAATKYKITYEVGLTVTQSENFKKATNMTVGAEVGAEYGGVSAKVTVSYSESFELDTSRSTEKNTVHTRESEFELPGEVTTYFWQKRDTIAVYRMDGTTQSTISYGNKDTTTTHEK